MTNYKPRRQTKRWLDSDCPKGVLCIMDNKGKTADRYTVFYAEPVFGSSYSDMVIGYRDMSENPFHPQGVGMFGEISAYNLAYYRAAKKNDYATWSSLPEKVKQCVRQDLERLS